jgi:hypothetical protein
MAVLNYSTVGGVVTPVDTAAQAMIPSMLNCAELRIQRDLDLLNSVVVNMTYNLTAGTNTLAVSVNDLQTIQTVSYTSGTSNVPLLPTSKEIIQNTYNDSSYTGPPLWLAVYGGDQATGGNTSANLLFGPYPDQNYALMITGTQNLQSLYATAGTNGAGTTYISTNYPDLLINASMVYIAQFQRNFLPTSNDPEMPGSYETQYQTLLASAKELENRKKFRDAAWSSQSQSPVATPSR